MTEPETVWHLEMLSRSDVVPSRSERHVDVRRARLPSPELNYWLYVMVGRAWQWTDRLSWDRETWRRYVERPGLETWLGYAEDTPIGYFELAAGDGDPNDIEIASFGLFPSFVGQGLGGGFLAHAALAAWDRPARRVWLHTCSFDHPHALANYQARGFRLFRTEERAKHFPEHPPPVPF